MKYCDRHWGQLRHAVELHGLKHLVLPETTARSAAALSWQYLDAAKDPAKMITLVEARKDAKECALYTAYTMALAHIMNKMIAVGSLGAPCPICAAIQSLAGEHPREEIEDYYANGPAGAALAYFDEKGLIK